MFTWCHGFEDGKAEVTVGLLKRGFEIKWQLRKLTVEREIESRFSMIEGKQNFYFKLKENPQIILNIVIQKNSTRGHFCVLDIIWRKIEKI